MQTEPLVIALLMISADGPGRKSSNLPVISLHCVWLTDSYFVEELRSFCCFEQLVTMCEYCCGHQKTCSTHQVGASASTCI